MFRDTGSFLQAGEKRQMNETTLSPSVCNYAALRRATRGMGQLYDQALAPSGLNAAQHGLLNSIARLKNPSQSDLAADLVMDLSALGHTLKPLVRDGFVQLLPDAIDKRKRRVTLTAAGAAKLRDTGKLQKTVQRRLEAVLGQREAGALRAMLDYLSSSDFSAEFGR
jgi:DNA-binding MarR family transcriptional regulator